MSEKKTEINKAELEDLKDTSEAMEQLMAESRTGSTDGKPFFEKAYNALRLEKKRMKSDLVKKALVRKLEEAWDDAERRKEEAEIALFEMRTDNLDTYNVSEVLRHRKAIYNCGLVQDWVEEEHKFMFGTELRKS